MSDKPSQENFGKSELLENLLSATGISEELIFSEINLLSQKAGLDPKELSLEDLRQILADYVQEVLLSAKENFGTQNKSGRELTDESTPLFPADLK